MRVDAVVASDSLDLPVLVEIQDKDGIVYTGHASYAEIRQEASFGGYQLGSLDINTSVTPWRADIQINGVGGFTVRQGEPHKLSKLSMKMIDLDYVQGLEERVAQLEAELLKRVDK